MGPLAGSQGLWKHIWCTGAGSPEAGTRRGVSSRGLVTYSSHSSCKAEPAHANLAAGVGKQLHHEQHETPHRYQFKKRWRKRRIPEDAQREKTQNNKLPIQPSLWKQLILRFSFCCCAQSYQQSLYERADDTELSELLPVSCMGSEGSADGWLETQLISIEPAALRGEQILFLTPFGVLSSPFPKPSLLWEERFKPMYSKEKRTAFSSSSRRVMKPSFHCSRTCTGLLT